MGGNVVNHAESAWRNPYASLFVVAFRDNAAVWLHALPSPAHSTDNVLLLFAGLLHALQVRNQYSSCFPDRNAGK